MKYLPLFLFIVLPARGNDLEELWKLPVVYEDPGSRGLREFAFSANLQWQWADGQSNQGNFGSRDRPDEVTWGGVEVRRMEIGFRSLWGDSFKIAGSFDADPGGPSGGFQADTRFYRNLHDFSIVWSPSPELSIGVGKITTKFFSYENSVSSRELIIFERSLLVENLISREMTGVWINGTANRWIYDFAAYAGDYQREFPRFNAGFIIQEGIGYDLTEILGVDKAFVKLDHQYSSSEDNSGNSSRFTHSFSLNSLVRDGPFSIYADLLGGFGRGDQGNVIGLTITPSYHLTEKLELVFRYQHANGSDDGLQLLSRYERLAPDLEHSGRGSSFDAVYLGLNYYIYGHKFKLMAGTEYQHLDGGRNGDNYDGFTTLAGIRINF